MANVLVTGGTGFLGKYLVNTLLAQGNQVTLLIRSPTKLDALKQHPRWHSLPNAVEVLEGDLRAPNAGLKDPSGLAYFEAIYHLAAIYDVSADADAISTTNVTGTQNLLSALTHADFRGALHFVSSIAVAGDYRGTFTEDMFDEGQAFQHAYNQSKFESEKCVRTWAAERQTTGRATDVRIYRPSAIVGDTLSGYCERIDGPYFLFNVIAKLRKAVPSWMPLIAPKLPMRVDMVPVDYVANAMVALSQRPREEMHTQIPCYHLTDPEARSLTRLLNRVLKAADGPTIRAAFPFGSKGTGARGNSGKGPLAMARSLKGVELLSQSVFDWLEVPAGVLDAMMPRVRFDATRTRQQLDQAGVPLPPLESYIDTLWDYYNRHLDPAKNQMAKRQAAFLNKYIVITGASSGIGLASARSALTLGAHVALVARNPEKLQQAYDTLRPLAEEHSVNLWQFPCDISNLADCDQLIATLQKTLPRVDILFNNAGKSIRRSINQSWERFHDLERTMQLNYYGSARLMIGLLPAMIAQGGGHLIYSSTMGTMAPTPRFGPYLASKAAMDALMDSLAAEFADRNIVATSVKFPLVKTEMISPTKEYEDAPAASPEFAANLFVQAVQNKPRKQITGTGKIMGALSLWAPSFMTQLYNYAYRIWPDESDQYPEMGLDRMIVKQTIKHSPL